MNMLKVRIITAVVLLSLIALSLFYWPTYAWMLFCTVLLAGAVFEWTRFARYSAVGQNTYIISTLFIAYYFLMWANSYARLCLYSAAILFWCVIVPLWLKNKWQLSANKLLAALTGWLILWPAFDVLYQARQTVLTTQTLLSLVVIIWIADTAAYFAGRLYGRHKLAPTISPGKSWEGVLGAIGAVSLYALTLSYFGMAPIVSIVFWLPFVWIMTVISIMGDLLESLFKRQVDMKDSSNFLPGHGGILDRLDSLLALLPFAGMLMWSMQWLKEISIS